MIELGIMKTQTEKIDKSILLDFTTMRKCTECKEYIQLEKFIKYERKEDEFFYYKEKLYHCQCLINKLKSKKIGKMSEEDILVLIDGLRDESYNHGFNLVVKNHIYKYLMNKYDVIMLPTYIYTKMEQLFTGTYKNMTKAIVPWHLLDMLIRKENYLDSIYHKEKLDGVAKINYNLQVIISKYNDYLSWLEKSKIDTKKSEEFIKKEKININKLSKSVEIEKNILDE